MRLEFKLQISKQCRNCKHVKFYVAINPKENSYTRKYTCDQQETFSYFFVNNKDNMCTKFEYKERFKKL